MKFPSIQSLWIDIQRVMLRFPLQILAAVVAVIAWCYFSDLQERNITAEYLIKLIAICNLALVLLLAGDLYAEVNQFISAKKWSLRGIVVLICTGLYFILNPAIYTADVFRIGLLAFAFHLLVAFAPFIRKGHLNSFWQFNKTMFLRFLTSALYAVVLYAGLAIALMTIHGLFNVDFTNKVYTELFALITAGFMTIFFLAGIPEDIESLDKEDFYPKGLKIFTQYVLIPLTTIYLIILLVYEVKIIIQWKLPKGMVSSLILGYAVFGILSLLLVYPIKEKEGNSWIKLFFRFFYVMMIPLIVLLVLAIWKRISNYGITESRYILVILTLWLFLITVYFFLSKIQNIKIIPISLCILALFASYGPQSAFSVSRHSQVARLKRLMISKLKKDIDEREDVIKYLVDMHGLSSLQDFTKVNLYDLENRIEHNIDNKPRYKIENNKVDTAYALLKVEKSKNKYRSSIIFIPEGHEMIDIKGYDFMVSINSSASKTEAKMNGVPIVIEREGSNKNLKIEINDELLTSLDMNQMMLNAVNQTKTGNLKEKANSDNTFYLSKKFFTLFQHLNHYDIMFIATSISTNTEHEDQEEMDKWVNYDGYLLIRIRQDH